MCDVRKQTLRNTRATNELTATCAARSGNGYALFLIGLIAAWVSLIDFVGIISIVAIAVVRKAMGFMV